MARTKKLSKIRQAIYTIISEQFGVKTSEIKDEDTVDSLGGDSLDAVEAVMCLEEHFESEVDEATYQAWTNVAQVVAFFEGEDAAQRRDRKEEIEAAKAKPNPHRETLGMNTTTAQTIRSFASASKSMVASVRADLKALDTAETQAHTKAMAAVDALPEIKRIVQPNSWYLTQGQGKSNTIILGPFKMRSSVHTALRAYVRKNPEVNPLALFVALGNRLRLRGTKFSPAYVPPRGVTGRTVSVAVPKAKIKRVNPERVKAQQEAMRKRRLLSRANSTVMRATAPLYGKLYVVDDKASLLLSGPYSTHSAAKFAIPADAKELIVLSGQQCASANIDYSRKFQEVGQKKLSSHFFAEDQHVLLNGKRVRITAVDIKAKTATVSGLAFAQSVFTLNYSRRILALNIQ